MLKSWVHNCTPNISISCLPPCRGHTEIQTFQVILDRSEPGVTWSSWWSSPVGRWPLDCCHNDAVVVLTRWAASNKLKELQSTTHHRWRRRWASTDSSDLSICDVTDVCNTQNLAYGHRGVFSCSSLGWPAGWPDMYLGSQEFRMT